MDETRDAEIARLLSGGSVAEHEPGYWDALRAAVAPEFAVLELGALHRPRPRKRRLLRLGLAAAAVAAAAVIAFAVLPALRGTDTATAADMLASMNAAATGKAHVVRLSVKEAGETRPTPEQLILSTSGDVRWVVKGRRETSYWTQDERRHETMSLGVVTPDDGNSVLAIERPSWGANIYETWPCGNIQALAGSLRAQLAEGDPEAPVSETTYLGRPAWQAVLSEHWAGNAEHPEGATTTWNVIVDKETGLLLASGMGFPEADGREHPPEGYSFWVTRIQVDPKLPDGWQRLSQRGQERILIQDYGTRFGTPQSVAKRSWPTPVLIPRRVPSGYRLTDVAITYFQGMRSPKDEAKLVYHSRRPHPYKAEWIRTSVDGSVRRVVARYRRGFSSFVVDVRPPARGDAELGEFGTNLLDGADGKLTAGYLKGQLAGTSISPNGSQGPTLLARSGRYTIAIYGDLTRQELLDVANSLTATGGAGE